MYPAVQLGESLERKFSRYGAGVKTNRMIQGFSFVIVSPLDLTGTVQRTGLTTLVHLLYADNFVVGRAQRKIPGAQDQHFRTTLEGC